MKKSISLFILLMTIFAIPLTFVGCGANCGFSLKEIEKIEFYGNYVDYSISATFVAGTDDKTIKDAYDQIKDVKINKKFPSKDFWTQQPVTYTQPERGSLITFSLKGEKTVSYYVADSRLYKYGNYQNYSTKGVGIVNVLRDEARKQSPQRPAV